MSVLKPGSFRTILRRYTLGVAGVDGGLHHWVPFTIHDVRRVTHDDGKLVHQHSIDDLIEDIKKNIHVLFYPMYYNYAGQIKTSPIPFRAWQTFLVILSGSMLVFILNIGNTVGVILLWPLRSWVLLLSSSHTWVQRHLNYLQCQSRLEE